MNKLKIFFTPLFRSATDPEYYREVVTAKSGFSLKYFSAFYVFLAISITTTLYFTSLRQAPNQVTEFLQSAADLYPTDLEVTLDTVTSEISTKGVPEPIIIPLPTSVNVETDIKNLAVIDTSATSEQISSYQTAVLITKTHLATLSDSNSGYQIFPISEFTQNLKEDENGHAITSLTLNKGLIDSYLPLVKQTSLKFLQVLPAIMAPVLFVGYFIGRLIFLAFFSLITTLMAGIMGRGLRYGQLFLIGLHTITITDAITKLSQLAFKNPVDSLYGFAFLGITFIALLGIPRQPLKTISA